MTDFQEVPVGGPGSPAATLLLEAGEPGTIVNTDTENTLTIGKTNDIQVGYQSTAPLYPGQALPFDGATDVYGIAPNGLTINVLVLPGARGGPSGPSLSPSFNPSSIATATATAGSTVDVIGTALNPSKLSIQLLSAVMSVFCAAGSSATAQNLQDVLQDDHAFPYLTVQTGVPSGGGISDPTATLDYKGSLVPAGRKLQLVNGGGVGVLHQVSVTVLYYLVNTMP